MRGVVSRVVLLCVAVAAFVGCLVVLAAVRGDPSAAWARGDRLRVAGDAQAAVGAAGAAVTAVLVPLFGNNYGPQCGKVKLSGSLPLSFEADDNSETFKMRVDKDDLLTFVAYSPTASITVLDVNCQNVLAKSTVHSSGMFVSLPFKANMFTDYVLSISGGFVAAVTIISSEHANLI
ncbi:hypothetical protein Pelo_13755 [Pelomyxa schiedti]|nr:hypothetical protein Pelo_13755 [Pelomyxa schiedti]